MKRTLYACIIIFIFISCQKEFPSPENFLEYQNPFQQLLSPEKLDELNEEILTGTYGEIHSLIILRNDNVVFENYYSGYKRSDLHPTGATTQSIVSALFGISQNEDSTISIREPIINLLPDYNQYFENIPQKDKIEISHLLSNTSGLWWDEWGYLFGNENNDAYTMTLSDDWISNVLSTSMIREPGYEFNFNSGHGILMAPIMQVLTGIELEQYAKEKLFEPLQIVDWNWERIPGEYINAAWGLHLKPVDMAKIGYLYLKNGMWEEQMIFDENWKKRSTRNRASVSNYFNYAYGWWRFTDYADAIQELRINDAFFSWGDGGQFIFVIPHLEMVVVSTAANYGQNETMTIGMLRDYIFESVYDKYQ